MNKLIGKAIKFFKTISAMVTKLDDSVGEVVAALQRRDMLKNSIILFMSDNGAPTMGLHYNSGSNYPLRGVSYLFLSSTQVFSLSTRFLFFCYLIRLKTVLGKVEYAM